MIQKFTIAIAVIACCGAPLSALAQDSEVAGTSRGGYAWGEAATDAGPAMDGPDDPLRIMAFLGGGLGVRLIKNRTYSQDWIAPAYLNASGAVFFPGRRIRHGVGLGITTNISRDGTNGASGTAELTQWSFTPSYYLQLPLLRHIPSLEHDWLQFQARIGVPLTLSDGDFIVGAEVGAALHFKFLQGLGIYFETEMATYFAEESSGGQTSAVIHPVLGLELGLLFDYEVLP